MVPRGGRGPGTLGQFPGTPPTPPPPWVGRKGPSRQVRAPHGAVRLGV